MPPNTLNKYTLLRARIPKLGHVTLKIGTELLKIITELVKIVTIC